MERSEEEERSSKNNTKISMDDAYTVAGYAQLVPDMPTNRDDGS